MRIKVSRILQGNKPQQKYADYPIEVKEYRERRLSQFREFAQGKELIQGTDRFRSGDETLDVEDEKIFLLSELLAGGLTGDVLTNNGIITLWSQEFIAEREKPEEPEEKSLTLTVKRKPAGLGDKTDKTYKLPEPAFNAMKLDELRTKLLAQGYIARDDQFVDQGVPIEIAKEASRDALGITKDNTIAVWNKAEINKLEWAEKAPKIELPDPKLKPPTLPGHEESPDRTGDGPNGFHSAKPDKAVVFSQLDAADLRAILTDSRLYPSVASPPCCAALTVGDEIEFARDHIVTCKRIRTVGTPFSREDTIDFSYSEEVAKWQRQLVTEVSVGANVPLAFGLSGKYIHTDARRTFKKNVEVSLTASIAIPKLRAILDEVSVSEEFSQAIEETIHGRDAQEMMRRLAAKGHLVGTDFLLGGKVVCSTKKVLDEDYTAQKLGHEFSLAAQGSFEAEGVPVTLDGGGGWKNLTAQEKKTISQRYALKAKTFGGFGESSGSNPKDLGKNWLETVRDYPRTWTVIGIVGEVRPSLSYLSPSLQKEAKAVLRNYFDSRLTTQQVVAGNVREKMWSDDLTNVGRIAGVNLHFGALVDGVQTVYDLTGSAQRLTHWHGESRKELKPDASFKLEPGDEIVGVEVGTDQTVDHLVFWTKDGRRYPPTGQYGGRNAKNVTVFGQPRIRGFHGTSAHYLDAFGVKYLELTKDLGTGVKKSALLSLERYIYS